MGGPGGFQSRQPWSAGMPGLRTPPAQASGNDCPGRPQLVDSWDRLRNGPEVSTETVTCGSNRMFWWVCPAGHGWRARVADRASGDGCPMCAGHYIDPLTETHPELVAEWAPELNEASPESVTAGSAREVTWRCRRGHRWVQAEGIRADVVHDRLVAMGFAGDERTTRRAVAEAKDAYAAGHRRTYRPWIPEPG